MVCFSFLHYTSLCISCDKNLEEFLMLCYVFWGSCFNFLSVKFYVCTWIDLLFVNSVRSRPKVHKQVLASLVEAHGVGTQPQTDGQTKRVNLVIQQFLRNYVAMDQQDWVDHLELIEFCYNNSEHSATKSTPFQMVTGNSPIVPITWATHGQPPSDASEEVPMVT